MAKKAMKRAVAVKVVRAKKTGALQALTAAKAEHALSVSERAKIKKLLLTKTLEPVSLGLTLLESTAATPADWEAIFTPQIFTSLLNIFRCMRAAEPLYRRALEGREKSLGPDHPDTLVSVNNLAILLKNQGDYAAAEPLYRRALEVREKALGPDHPDTLVSAHNLASLLDEAAENAPPPPPAGPFAAPPGTITNSIGMKFVPVPAGAFLMGSPEDCPLGDPEEEFQHHVRITNLFLLGMHQVTQSQYEQVTGEKPSFFNGPDLPVEHLAWREAQQFCELLSELPAERAAGRRYRLPTEAEWEYACRAGTTTTFNAGDALELHEARFAITNRSSPKKTAPVGIYPPNAWGLFDMHGNVWEWTADWFSADYFRESPVDDPQGPATGTHHTLRGGSASVLGLECRSALRGESAVDGPKNDTGNRFVFYGDFGIRVVCESRTDMGAALPAATAVAKAEHALSVSERAKIKKLLRTKTLEPVSLGLMLLESTAATPADWEAIFTPQISTSLLNSWVPEIWELVGKSLESYCELSASFQTLALERYRTRPWKQKNFDGLLLARKGVCRPAFVKRWSADEQPRAFMDFISIPAGSFTMGSPEKEKERLLDEKQVPVTITRAFELGKTVVTQKQWTEVMGTDPWNWNWKKSGQTGDNYPAVYVSWLDASLFCEHLTSYEREAGRLSANQKYRLPTEAEWEYACRAGTTTAYSCGNAESSLGDYAWYRENSGLELHEVATKKPNPWGLFDMHGNVYEWCEDWKNWLFGGNDPKGSLCGKGPSAGDHRVIRGGSWFSSCRSAFRSANPAPTSGHDYVGFRIVRVLL